MAASGLRMSWAIFVKVSAISSGESTAGWVEYLQFNVNQLLPCLRKTGNHVPPCAASTGELGVNFMKALLLDLDGTLLGMDWDTFMSEYFRLLTAELSDIMAPELLYKRVWKATEAMIVNDDPTITNQQVFISDFFSGLSLKPDEVMPRFDRFYSNTFPQLQKHTRPVPGARRLITVAQEMGLKVVVATNPVFPREAILQRIQWAELGDFSFDLVTTYEFMHFCKPNPRYYLEVAELLGVAPQDCLMVGNDMEEDMSAGRLGMRTFLADQYLISRGELDYTPDGRGTLLDLAQRLAQFASMQTQEL